MSYKIAGMHEASFPASANAKIRCSLSYGTPPQIRSSQYDVLPPPVEAMCGSSDDRSPATIYLTLLSLTGELGYLLEHVYDLRPSPLASAIEHPDDALELRLSSWVDGLSSHIRSIVLRGTKLEIPGAANLRLAYLATNLLLCRICLDLDGQPIDPRVSQSYRHLRARRAAEDIVHFTQSLEEKHIRGFWMPQNGASLTSATAFLLRIAVRCISNGEHAEGNASLSLAARMIDTLRHFQKTFEWDLADHCIAQYGELVDRMANMRQATDSNSSSHTAPVASFAAFDEFASHSMDFPSLELDSMFPSLWDMFEA